MKYLYLSVAFTVGILLVNCEPNTNASPENTNETPLEKTVITGFGARTHSGSVSRIVLRMSRLN